MAEPKSALKSSAKSLQDIEREIHELQLQAETLRVEEKKKAITEAKALILKFGLTTADLGIRQKAKLQPAPPKYADGKGNTWHGKGVHPSWLKQEIASGKSKDEFLVGP